MRRALRVNGTRAQVAVGAALPAPVGGWDAISPLAAMKPDRAITLDNWFPQPGYVEVRRGHYGHAGTQSGEPVESLMAYNGLTGSKLFAVTDGDIYDVTSTTAAITSITSLNNSRCQHVNMATSGGQFLWLCNGADTPKHYNGTTWATPSITGITSTDIVNVCQHKKRLWFVLTNKLDAAYLPTDAVAGAATVFPLAAGFSLGGHLVAIASWSRDGGSGPDDYLAFITSQGQVAIYAGTDPASANTFGLVGIFKLGAPIGYRCTIKLGPDLAVLCVDGVVPLSQALSSDRVQSPLITLTKNIQSAMNEAAQAHKSNFGWQLVSFPKGTRFFVNVPVDESVTQHQYVMNTITGAWCRFSGMNASCWETMDDRLFMGGNDGTVYEAEVGGLDNNLSIEGDLRQAFNYFGDRGRNKRFTMIQPLISSASPSPPSLTLDVDFRTGSSLSTPTVAVVPTAKWDDATWDADQWPVEGGLSSSWTAVSALGHCASLRLRARTGSGYQFAFLVWDESTWGSSVWGPADTRDINVRYNGAHVVYEHGAFI